MIVFSKWDHCSWYEALWDKHLINWAFICSLVLAHIWHLFVIVVLVFVRIKRKEFIFCNYSKIYRLYVICICLRFNERFDYS